MTDNRKSSTEAARTVLITGTSSGIGLATAVAAAAAGWTVIATMRDLTRAGSLRAAAAAAAVTVDVRMLDVTDPGSVADVLADCVSRHGRLDAIVNNAGSASVGTVETSTLAEFRRSMEVNFFGVVNVTRAAMPQLRATGGRVVTISSVGGVVGQPFNEAYCAAKFAVEGFLESLHPVARTVGVGIHLIEPGAVASEFVANAAVDPEVMLAGAGAYAPALASYLQRTMAQFAGRDAQTSAAVADLVVETLNAENPPFRAQTSEWARDFAATKLADLDGSRVTAMTTGWVSP